MEQGDCLTHGWYPRNLPSGAELQSRLPELSRASHPTPGMSSLQTPELISPSLEMQLEGRILRGDFSSDLCPSVLSTYFQCSTYVVVTRLFSKRWLPRTSLTSVT